MIFKYSIDLGFMKVQLSMENGKRWSTDKLLYESLKDKLTIITYAHVEKVYIENKFFKYNSNFFKLFLIITISLIY